ncbi:MAG: ACP phosphodiesterase [Prevotellaceae bacterium]|nr:ACP phosphodiesterase [Prevotellaceae bacterium]
MNYLAHILLSGNNAQRQVGGFIADFVKGNRFEHFPEHIRQGIVLHRRVDAFTDEHPLVREARALLRPYFGRYAGIFLDIFYDYFLAKNWHRFAPPSSGWRKFSNTSLKYFAYRFYANLVWSRRWLPISVKGFLWHFIGTNRLCKYAAKSGVQRALWIMGTYSSLPQMSEEAIQILQKHEVELEKNFLIFFPILQEYARTLLVPRNV